MLIFLSYILKIINDLNKEFQSEKVRLPYLYAHIESNFKLILSNFMTTKFLKNVSCLEDINFCSSADHLPIQNIFIGIKAETYFQSCDFPESKKN